jgi:DNA modification methylase
MGTNAQSVDGELYGLDLFGEPAVPPGRGALAGRFLVPPFTILNAGEGFWQDRKRAWLGFGIQSEVGRADTAAAYGTALGNWMDENAGGHRGGARASQEQRAERYGHDAASKDTSGISVFDPVLCELAYRWFAPAGGQVVDPFAGGSVRGIVAHKMGLRYWGCDLSAAQVAANYVQRAEIARLTDILCPDTLTPVWRDEESGVWLKRDDLFVVAGVRGGKVRTCRHLVLQAAAQGLPGVVTAGSRSSPQVAIVAALAKLYGLKCRVHTPGGDYTPVLEFAEQHGAEVVQHRPGHNSVIVARAREDAEERQWGSVPFGMDCQEAVEQTRRQVANVPAGVERLVVAVGSGMTLAGVLWGLRDVGRRLPVLGVRVGADPGKRLDIYAPPGWREEVELVDAAVDYHESIRASVAGVPLDAHYEAKAARHLREGDCLWVVGVRPSAMPEQAGGDALVWRCGDSMEVLDEAPEADLLFSCPPYGDLEVYSDDPADISNMEWHSFTAAHARIIMRGARRLKDNRFAVWVVGDVRNKKTGMLRNFIGQTVAAFEACGLALYNEGILVTPRGTLPIRTSRQFSAGRKLGKAHQNILVFAKGDPRKAADACAPFDSR